MVNRTSQQESNSEKIFFKRIFQNPTFLLGIILVIGAALRIYELGTESYWIDEMFTISEAQQSIPKIIMSGRLDQPPAYYLPFHFWMKAFGTSEISTRSFSVIFGIGAIVAIYLIGRELFNNKIGLISAFFMAVSWFQIYYSQTTRYYIFVEFFALLSILFLILALRREKILLLIPYVLASILMLYSHIFSVFILAAQNLYFFIYWRQYKKFIFSWIISQMLVVGAFIPSLYILVSRGGIGGAAASNIGDWIVKPSIKEFIRTIYNYLFPQNYHHSWVFIIISFALGFAVFAIGTFLINRSKLKNKKNSFLSKWFQRTRKNIHISNEFVLVILWFVCPILIPFIYSRIFSPIFVDRYTIFAAPAFYLLIAMAISSIRRIVPIALSLASMMIVILPGLCDFYATDVNDQWREVAAYIQKNALANDVVVIAPNQKNIEYINFDWYYSGDLPTCGISGLIDEYNPFVMALSNCTSGHDRFWVVMYSTPNDQIYNRYTSFFSKLIPNEIEPINQWEFVGINVFLFELENK